MNAHRLTAAIGLATMLGLGGVTVQGGCAPDDDGPTAHRYKDASQGCNSSSNRLERPVAVGARLDLAVEASGREVKVSGAKSSNKAVLDVDSVDNPIRLRALATGTARIDVEDTAGISGSVDLTTADVAKSTISADDLTVWNLGVNLQVVHPDATESFFAEGYALLADAELKLKVTLEDADGVDLIGYGAAAWSADPANVTFENPDPLKDDVLIRPTGTTGEVKLTTAGGGTFDIEVVDTQDANSLKAYFPDTGTTGDSMSIGVGETKSVVLLAFTAGGKLLLGNGPNGFTTEITAVDGDAASILAVSNPPWAKPEGDVDLDDKGKAFLTTSRVVYVNGVAPGDVTLRLTAAGKTLDLPVVVVSP